MNKFRASYTILSTWAKGDWERAIKYYFKLEEFSTRQTEEGRILHEKWENEIKKTGCLPKVFGGSKLNDPKPEKKIVVQIYDWLELVGVIDCLDVPEIHEFKSGKSKDSEGYSNDIQTGIYGVLATLDKRFVNVSKIHHYDQYSKKSDMSIVYITDEYLKKAFNYIETISSEMHSYFIKNDLYKKFKKHV